MMRRIAMISFLVGAPLMLSSCALANLAQAPFTLLGRLLSAGGRTVGLGADNNTRQPLRLDPAEIERAREAQGLPALAPEVKPSEPEHVASR